MSADIWSKTMTSIKQHVLNNAKVRFEYYRDSQLWYRCDSGFAFPVPVNDTGTAIFKSEDRAILFMRWIRKQTDFLATVENEHNHQLIHGGCFGGSI